MSGSIDTSGGSFVRKILRRTSLPAIYRRYCRLKGANFHSRDSVDRWIRSLWIDSPGRHLPPGTNIPQFSEWVYQLHAAKPTKTFPPKRILAFTSMWHWNLLCEPVVMALTGMGCSVDFVWVPYDHSHLPEPCEENFQPQRRPFLKLHPRLRIANLLDLKPGPFEPAMQRIVEKFADRDTAYSFFKEKADIANSPEDRERYDFRYRRDRVAIERLAPLLQKEKYDVVLIPNGAIYEFGTLYDWCKLQGQTTVTYDGHERRCAINVSNRRPCPEGDTDTLWAADAPHDLPPEREARIKSLLSRRENPNWDASKEYIWAGQKVAKQDAHVLYEQLQLDPNKPTALLCSNVCWDAAVLGRCRTFPTMAEWIVETVRWFANRPDWQLIVRVHPAEARIPNAQPVVETVQKAMPVMPPHIRVIGPSEPFNTYGLMRLANFGMVYSTNAGLEMSTRGIPLIVTGKTHYAEKGFTWEFPNPESYYAFLTQVLDQPESFKMTEAQTRLALAYADVYFEQFPNPFPWWDLHDVKHYTDEFPLEKFFADDCPPEYRKTLAKLADIVE